MTQFNIDQLRQRFPNLHVKVHGKPLSYLDNAATTFKADTVIRALGEHYSHGVANIHRGVHYLSEHATAQYEGSREKIRKFLNAQKTTEIIFTPGTTAAINLVAQTYGRQFIKDGDEILITHMEHHSNIVPWQILCEEQGCVLKVVPINDAGEIIMEEFYKLLGPKTKLVSVVHISNSLGTINPVKEIIAAAHKLNIPVLVDGAQSVSYKRPDVQDLDCDFFAFSGHKLYGPTGIGVLYGKEKWLAKLPPYQGGGDMIASVTFEKTTYNTLPYKFEAGTPHIAGVIGLGAAIDFLDTLDQAALMAHKQDLLDYGTRELLNIPGLKLIGTAKEKTAILAFVLPEIHPHDLGTIVDQEGVAIRTGHHCTQPVMNRYNIPATARASLAIYNTRNDIDGLVKAVLKAKEIFK